MSSLRLALARPFVALLLVVAIPSVSAAQKKKTGGGGSGGTVTPFLIGNDTTPPTVTISPSGGTQSTSVSVTVTFCDTQSSLSLGTKAFTLNGTSVAGSFTGGTITQAGCTGAARYTGTLTLPGGNSTFVASIDDQPLNVGQGTAVYSNPHAAAVLSNDWNHSDFHDATHCVANCFETTLSYSTPAYTSLDQPRSATLLYRSGSAAPRPTFVIHANDVSTSPANTLSLKLQASNGTYVALNNGLTEVYYAGAAGNHWLAAQFDGTTLATGAYDYTAIVTSRWTDGTVLTSSLPIRVLVINESASPFGAGWTLAGLQKISRAGTSNGALVTDGTGTAVFFPGCSGQTSCTFGHAEGDFSTLTICSGTYTRLYPDGSHTYYDATGRETSSADRYGNTTQYNYFTSGAGNGSLMAITDPTGQVINFGYEDGTDPGYKVGTIRGIYTPGNGLPNSRNAYFAVNTAGDLTDLLDVDGIYFGFAGYDGSHRITQFTDRRGGVWNYAYSTDGALASVTAPSVTVNGQSARPVTAYVGPSTRALIAFTGTVGTASNPFSGNHDVRATVTDPRGYSTYYYIRRWGVLNATDPLGHTDGFAYDTTDGRLTTVTYYGGRTVTNTWSGPDLTSTADSWTGATVNTTYESVYHRPTHTWGNTLERYYFYTNARLDSVWTGSSSSHSTAHYGSDSKGRITELVDGGGHTTDYYYHATGLQDLDSVVAPGARRTKFMSDAYGRRVATYGPPISGLRLDSTQYDPLNRVSASVNGSGYKTSYQFDSLYLRKVIDAKGQAFTYSRNALGWTTAEVRPDTSIALTATYDSAGNVLTTTSRRGGSVTYTYDPLGRPLTQLADGQTTTYSYTAYSSPQSGVGSLTVISNAQSLDTLFFDPAGRLITRKTVRGANWYSAHQSYSPGGVRTQLDVSSNKWSGNKTTTWGYVNEFTLQSLTSYMPTGSGSCPTNTTTVGVNTERFATGFTYPCSRSVTIDRVSIHSETGRDYSDPAANAAFGIHLETDENGQFSNRYPAASTDTVTQYDYTLDQRLSVWHRYAGAAQSCYLDPDIGEVCSGVPQTLVASGGYSYDSVGTRLDAGTSLAPGYRVLAADGYTYSYDPDGNLTYRHATGFDQYIEWNTLGQITKITTNGTVETFTYDGLGDRVSKTVAGVTTGYLRDGSDLLMELDGTGAPTTEYDYWPGVDQPHGMLKGGVTYYFARSPVSNGATGVFRASDGAVMARFSYDPFGQLDATSYDNVGVNLRYAGREYDSESGFYYVRARWYDTQRGRFLSEDPLGAGAGPNLYAYAEGDPLKRTDPSGLAASDQTSDDCVSVDCNDNDAQHGGPFPARGMCSIMASCDATLRIAGTDAYYRAEDGTRSCSNFGSTLCSQVWTQIERLKNTTAGGCAAAGNRAADQMVHGELVYAGDSYASSTGGMVEALTHFDGSGAPTSVSLYSGAFEHGGGHLYEILAHEEFHWWNPTVRDVYVNGGTINSSNPAQAFATKCYDSYAADHP